MAERIKVVIASLLKPVDEPRMYSKLGRSLAQTNKYEVNIIGFRSKNLPNDPQVKFWPLFNFNRQSVKRLQAPLLFLQKLIQLKPEVVLVTTPELLPVSVVYKILFGIELMYDVQENYYQNIIWSTVKPSPFRRILAKAVRTLEMIADRMIVHYFLAERCYVNECSFISKPYTILENKAHKPSHEDLFQPTTPRAPLLLLYSGTVAEPYGIFDTIPLTDAIHEIHPHLIYTICGHCPSEEVYLRLQEIVSTRPWINLQISQTPLPHSVILEQLAKADFSLVAYRLNPSSIDCFPTRIWEALAWQTPMLLKKEHPWVNFLQQHQAGHSIDFLYPDKKELRRIILQETYYSKPLPESMYWESNEKDLLQSFERITAAISQKA